MVFIELVCVKVSLPTVFIFRYLLLLSFHAQKYSEADLLTKCDRLAGIHVE